MKTKNVKEAEKERHKMMREKVKTLSGKGVTQQNIITKVKENRELIIKGVTYTLIAYLFGGAEMIFETAPLGLALVCSLHEGVPAAALGLVLAVFTRYGGNPAVYMSGIVVSLGFRYTLSFVLRRGKSKFYTLSDGLVPRIAAAVSGGFTLSFIRIVYGGFRYYDILAAVFFILCAAGAVYAYSAYFDRGEADAQKNEAGIAAVIFSLVLSFSGMSIFGISLSVLAAFLMTMYAARRAGALRGVVIGFVCGAATDISMCVVYGVTGFICGLLAPLSAYIGVLFSVAAGLFCGMQTGGFEVITSNLPEAAAAVSLFLPSEYFGITKRINVFPSPLSFETANNSAVSVPYEEALENSGRDMRRLAEAYKSISDITADVSLAERMPDKASLKRICGSVFEEFCAECDNRYACFPENGCISEKQLGTMSRIIYEKKSVEKSDLPKRAAEKCPYPEGITVKINVEYSNLLKELVKCDRAGVVSSDTLIFSKLAERSYKRMNNKYKRNVAAEKTLLRSPVFYELFKDRVTVLGDRVKYVTAVGYDLRMIKQCADSVKKAAVRLLDEKFTDPKISEYNGAAVLKMETDVSYFAEAEICSKPKDGEAVNGDTAFYNSGADGRFYASVCDGMGSGKDAAVASKLSCIVLERLIYADCDRSDALSALNQIMRQRRAECFSTVDLLEFDTYTGCASFYKCGAAPSVILRGGKAYKIASHTPPVGIMEELCAEKIELELYEGDTVIMMSDGVTGGGEDIGRICAFLSDLDDLTPSGICSALIAEAEQRCGNTDDMTVLAVKIVKDVK